MLEPSLGLQYKQGLHGPVRFGNMTEWNGTKEVSHIAELEARLEGKSPHFHAC